jgi:hypothetical protein
MNKIVTIGRGPLAAAILAVLLGACDAPSGGLRSQATPTSEPTGTPAQSVAEASPSVAAEVPHVLVEGSDVSITVTIAAPGWVGEPGVGFLEKGDDEEEPHDGAGMIGYAGREYYVYGDACHYSTTRPGTPATTVDQLVDALVNQASREASAPEDITVDGYAGKKIILHMADGVEFDACDEGTFAMFGLPGDDLARYSQKPGQIEEVWAVGVDGVMVVLVGVFYADTPPGVVAELRAILASATFE